MTLIKKIKVMIYTKLDPNLFVLDFIKPRKAMVIDYGRSKQIISKNKQIQI